MHLVYFYLEKYSFNFKFHFITFAQYFLPYLNFLGAHVRGIDSYREMYSNSINNADEFWKTVAKELYFEKRSEKVGLR